MASAPLHLNPFFLDSRLLIRAWEMALDSHRGQSRKIDGAPFSNHLARVGAALHHCGYGEEVITAGLLHDILASSKVRVSELQRSFSNRVTALVIAVTEHYEIADPEARATERLERIISSGDDAITLYCADQVCNLEDLIIAHEVEGEHIAARLGAASLDQVINYYSHGHASLTAAFPECPLLADLQWNLGTLLRLSGRELDGFGR